MKDNKMLVALLIVLLSVSAIAADMSSSGRRILNQYQTGLAKRQNRLPFHPEYSATSIKKDLLDGELEVRALIQVTSDAAETELTQLGVRVDRQFDSMWSVTIPLPALKKLESLQNVEWIEVDTPVKRRLDAAGADVGLPAVRSGADLPQVVSGKGVLIGIVDGGYDYTHPVFKDSEGKLRVHSIWDQTDFSGNPPDGYDYGTLLTTESDILDKAHDMPQGLDYDTHGTHVAGIAGGRAADGEGKFWGAAPDAEFIFVTLSGGATDIFDAVEYIVDAAEAAGKPAVINMSLGSHLGPHDGTSFLDQYFEKKAGPGLILVGSAGNEGDNALHVSHQFSGDTVATAPELYYDEETATEGGVVELWGPANGSFSIAVGLIDISDGSLVYESDYFSSGLNDYFDDAGEANDGTTININGGAVAKHPNNDRPNIQVQIEHNTDYYAIIIVTAASGMVHMWNGTEFPFTNLGYDDDLLDGDTEVTVGEIGGTSRGVITVGAYTTKTQFTSIDGNTYQSESSDNLGALASFSSRGPTMDGRIKPDITAPGNAVSSAVSSRYLANESEMEARIDDTWPFVPFPGTSMSSPMVAGIVALMLEADATLSHVDVLAILKRTARVDGYTGAIPAVGSNSWGAGKVDAHAAVKEALGVSSVKQESIFPEQFALRQNVPNPFNPSTEIRFSIEKAGNVKLTVYDIQGRQVSQVVDAYRHAGEYAVHYDASGLASGIYVYRLESAGKLKHRKMVLTR